MREFKRFTEFRPRDRPVQIGIVARAIAGAILVHQVEIGVRRNFFGEEPRHFFGAGMRFAALDAAPAGRVAQGRPHRSRDRPPGGAFPYRGLVHPHIVADMRIPMREFGIAVLRIGHVDVDHAVQQSERFGAVVAAGVVDQRQAKALGRR